MDVVRRVLEPVVAYAVKDEPLDFTLLPVIVFMFLLGIGCASWFNGSAAAKDDFPGEEVEETFHRKKRRRRRADWEDKEDVKMVLVVRKDLKMSSGDCAEACASAAIGAVLETEKKKTWNLWKLQWDDIGVAKVALACPNAELFDSLQDNANKLELPKFVAVNSGNEAVIAVGPAPISMVNEVTGKLKLL